MDHNPGIGTKTMQYRPMWVWMFCAVLALTAANHVEKRVIHGTDAAEGDFPWATSIKGINPKTRSITYCGATIIADRWMISAAHCFWTNPSKKGYLMEPKNWHAQAGSTKIELGGGHTDNEKIIRASIKSTSSFQNFWGKLMKYLFPGQKPKPKKTIWHAHFKQIILHPKYRPDDLEYDIALIEISGHLPLHERKLSIAKLPTGLTTNQWPPIDSLCTFVGWGCHKKDGGPSKKAQVVSLKVLPNPVCSKLYNYGAGLNADHEFCAGYYKSSVGICAGDSGSGLIYVYDRQPVIVGVASATHAEHPQTYPGLFTRVASFTDWIFETIKASK